MIRPQTGREGAGTVRQGQRPLRVGARCQCSLYIAGPSADTLVAIGGRVARNSVLGCAITLDAISDRRSREQLQRLLLAYSDDPVALEREFRRDDAKRTGSD